MERKTMISIFCLSMIVVLFSTQCIPGSSSPDAPRKTLVQVAPTFTLDIAKVTPTYTHITPQVPTLFSTFTSFPTFEPTETPTIDPVERSIKISPFLIDNGGCRLPCFWGITPGKTTWKEAKELLANLSLIAQDFRYKDGIFHEINSKFVSNSQTVSFDLGLFDEKGVISILEILVSNIPASKYYTLPEILRNYGGPKVIGINLRIAGFYGYPDPAYLQVYLEYGNSWLRIYYDRKAVKSNNGETYRFCPTDPIQAIESTSIKMIIQAVEKPLDNESLSKKLEGLVISEPPSINRASNDKQSEFYENIVNGNQDFCLETPIKYWEQLLSNK
jgi:hypothetical protein